MNNLEFYRRKANLTMDELSEKTGIAKCDISRAENGIKDLSGQKWRALAVALECSIDELLNLRKG